MKNNDLVEIIYSESIEEYVIIIKRFPDKPVVISKSVDFDSIYDLCNYIDDDYYCNSIFNNSKKCLINNTYNRLYLSNGNDCDSCLNTMLRSPLKTIEIVEITNLEKFEIINKMLELREILIERGELDD